MSENYSAKVFTLQHDLKFLLMLFENVALKQMASPSCISSVI